MRISTRYDDLLDEGPGRALGRFLISFQALEMAVKNTLEIIAVPSDELGLPKLITEDYTARRRIRSGQQILKHIAKLYGVSDVEFQGRHTLVFGCKSPEETNQDIAQALAGIKAALVTAGSLLKYRNDLFHGEVRVEGNDVRFFARGTPIPSAPDEIEAKRQDVLRAVMWLYLAANSFRAAVEYLMRAEAKVGDAETSP